MYEVLNVGIQTVFVVRFFINRQKKVISQVLQWSPRNMSQPGGKKGGTGKGPSKDKNDDSKDAKNGKWRRPITMENTQKWKKSSLFDKKY